MTIYFKIKYLFITFTEEITVMDSVQYLCKIQEITLQTN